MAKTRMIIVAFVCVILAAGVTWIALTREAMRTAGGPEQPTPQPTLAGTGGVKPPAHETDFDVPAAMQHDAEATVESALVRPGEDDIPPADDDVTADDDNDIASTSPPPADTEFAEADPIKPATQAERTPAVADAASAKAAFDKGLAALSENDLLKARALLSQAVLSGALAATDDAKARDQLTQLVETTLWSRQVIEGDPYTYHYPVKSGEVLIAIERGESLRVPTEILVKINDLGTANALRAGARIKLIKGPFHAVIRKSDFTMDIYLHREGLDKIWITRLAVGTGKGGSTPEGLFQVGDLKTGTLRPGKLVRPTWTPTESSELRGPIVYGKPGYALGDKGLWIGLAGADETTRPLTDYAIHSTNMPDSIGKEMSSGCIRLADKDIDLAWSLLYEKWSTVRIVK
ncbi:MAG: L,D-transpeptidase [Phycisphaerae bacterium]|nr:L,D-transpeptidase [Phycisphaerae bacterium]